MKTTVVWKTGMEFEGQAGKHLVLMDAKSPLGKDAGATPKELVALGLGGCTAMDVVALLKKHKETPSSFKVEVDIQPTQGSYPVVFTRATLIFSVEGTIDTEKLKEAVALSQSKYCGVSAMLSEALPIDYRVLLNGVEVARGKAKFE